MATATIQQSHGPSKAIIFQLNNRWHREALWAYGAVVLAHWAEHLAQAWQIYVLEWPRSNALGVLGMVYPWLVKSEVMHYGYALVTLIGLFTLRSGFKGRSLRWWTISLGIQFWHHFEHLLLQGQALTGHNLFGSPVPTSILQLWLPRVELHLFYNTIVFIPMVVAMYHHMYPAPDDEVQHGCSCAIRTSSHPRPA